MLFFRNCINTGFCLASFVYVSEDYIANLLSHTYSGLSKSFKWLQAMCIFQFVVYLNTAKGNFKYLKATLYFESLHYRLDNFLWNIGRISLDRYIFI